MKSLRFPNARLYIHDLLVKRDITGAQAIQKGAKEFGVLADDHVLTVEGEQLSSICDCCRAAHNVLLQFFKQRNSSSYQKDTEQAWKSLTNRLIKYRRRLGEQEALPINCQPACSKLAPIIFDLMLQEVHCY
ncbi:MAG: hypothetical protein IT343_22005 [Candidatus Melainabacteria bacterium]|jgi:hypothetical protein|nr:hypothetical protein [Candidatus Melainabacteria bacterium]